jgi:hypothetical protein
VIKLEFNNNKKETAKKYSNTWRLNNTLLHDQWVIEEIREDIKKILEFNENKSTTYQNPWNTAKAVLRGKFTAMRACIKKTERSQIDDLMLHLFFFSFIVVLGEGILCHLYFQRFLQCIKYIIFEFTPCCTSNF